MHHPATFQDRWPQMKRVVLKILRQEPTSQVEWQNLFTDVYSVSTWYPSSIPEIFSELSNEITRHIKQAQERVLRHDEDSALLKAYIHEWSKFYEQCEYLPKPFVRIETTSNGNISTNPTYNAEKTTRNTDQVRQLMLESWNNNIFKDIKHRLQNSAMKLVQAERNGESFDSQLVIGVRDSYVSLKTDDKDKYKVYIENFERAYLNETTRFYKQKAGQYLTEHGILSYLHYADQKLKEEEKRARRYLESVPECNSVPLLVRRCVDVFVTEFREQITNECPNLIENNDIERLRLVFVLLDHTGDISSLTQSLESFIVKQGLDNMLKNKDTIKQDPESYVQQLLDLYRQFSNLVRDAFLNDPRFLTSRDKAFQKIINDISVFQLDMPARATRGTTRTTLAESRCPELLAQYCDILLRKGTSTHKKYSSEEIEVKLKDVLLLLKYVQNKDVFMRFYKGALTRRLILDTSIDNELEESIVIQLRDVGMPAEFIIKLQQMFKDLKLNRDMNEEFRTVCPSSRNNNTMMDSFSFKILSAAAWPHPGDKIDVSLPAQIEDVLPEIEEFYKKKHSGRKLTWYHTVSNGQLTFTSKNGKYDLDVSTLQASVLFSWNHRPTNKLTFSELKLATNIPEIELKKTLWSLISFAKLKQQLIYYEPHVESYQDLNEMSLFWINYDFTIIRAGKIQTRGHINMIQRLQLNTEKGREEENEEIMFLRGERTKEAIVKIMKTRQRMNNAQLQTELIEILKNMFVPSKKLIKEMIEWLIDHRYMARSETNISEYVYVA
ncbi:unnamed protein product [Rotaria sp. Silwood1]|nr:unnamed protein product [Rotaria sp. Silwood1]CAF0929945.1 unnamed protein product [Rotaria sp. Silwood1]CAF0962520.1 unnamed protein product [Rotaria sp. Silwood1]CAF3360889.1 unnamed protein product [Rotaria sp. Silwood1]CAF4780619.1 unnamed protein product [Rotaria sp. Silwood1]